MKSSVFYQLFMRDHQDEITVKIAGIYESYHESQPTDCPPADGCQMPGRRLVWI
jgi:hypothetical protein